MHDSITFVAHVIPVLPNANVHYYLHAPHALQQDECECGQVVLTMLEAVSESPGWMVAPTKAMVGFCCCWHASDSSTCIASPCSYITCNT